MLPWNLGRVFLGHGSIANRQKPSCLLIFCIGSHCLLKTYGKHKMRKQNNGEKKFDSCSITDIRHFRFLTSDTKARLTASRNQDD